MNNNRSTLKPALALKPLAACLTAALMAAGVAGATGTSLPASGHVAKSASAAARHMAPAMAAFLRAHPHGQSRHVAAPVVGVTAPVLNCADDSSAGSLRVVVAAASDGDTIDLSALVCSSITLTQGAISSSVANLTLLGPAATVLTIDGGNAGRVLDHEGAGTFTVDHLTISHGQYDGTGTQAVGGCIYSKGDIDLTHSTVSNCSVGAGAVVGFGAGIAAYGGATLSNATISGSAATGNGGGVATINGALSLESSTVSGNSGGRGAGVYTLHGDITVNNSTISGNNGTGLGGGMYSFYGQNMTVSNSTISGNTTTNKGGGIASYYGLSVHNSTVAFNTAASGGGIYLIAGTAESISSIVSNNTSTSGANDIGGAIDVTGSNNVIMSSEGATPGDTLAADPGLVALANNGGPTQTHELGSGSNAIDSGLNPASLAFDQRGTGFLRTFGAATDIGAFEVQPVVSDVIFADGFEGL
ncbi:MAG: choice-of-anchor Q domain-containing protein [Dokdonella sp.]